MSAVERISAPRPEQPFPEEWYDASEASHFWFRWRLVALRRALRDAGVAPGPLSALDVGCGSGVLAGQLEAELRWTVDGTDLNLVALERCAPRQGRSLYYDVLEERAEFVGRYDAAVLFDVLEHVADPRALVRAAIRHVRPGGLLLVNVPALPALTSAYDRAAGHLRRYTRESLAADLETPGLERRVLRYWGLSLVPLLAARKALLARGGPRTIERGFRPPFPGVNAALAGLMRLETTLMASPPLGTSVLGVAVRR